MSCKAYCCSIWLLVLLEWTAVVWLYRELCDIWKSQTSSSAPHVCEDNWLSEIQKNVWTRFNGLITAPFFISCVNKISGWIVIFFRRCINGRQWKKGPIVGQSLEPIRASWHMQMQCVIKQYMMKQLKLIFSYCWVQGIHALPLSYKPSPEPMTQK